MQIAALKLRVVEPEDATSTARRASHLIKRGRIWYLRIQRCRQRFFESTKTENLGMARKIAKLKIQAIEANRLEDLQATRVKRPMATIAAILKAYEIVTGRIGMPRRETVASNLAAMRRVLAASGLAEAQSCDALRGEILDAYAEQQIGDTRPESEEGKRRRRSVAANVRFAKSILKPCLVAAYRRMGLQVPDFSDFRATVPTAAPRVQYLPPTDEEMRPILQGAESLTGQMRTIWLLAFHLAMRAREISEARWEWIEPRDGRAWMHICARPGFDPKGTAGWVPISAPVAAELLAIRGASGAGYILGELPVTRRYDLVKRDFAAWMRRAGWARRHTAHELRAYRIHVWRRAYGLDVARDWARHRNASVTESHYSDNYNPSREPIA